MIQRDFYCFFCKEQVNPHATKANYGFGIPFRMIDKSLQFIELGL